jgi:hypothetical protein
MKSLLKYNAKRVAMLVREHRIETSLGQPLVVIGINAENVNLGRQ